MSDLTHLLRQYQRRAEFAQQVNDAVLDLKRRTAAGPVDVGADTTEFLANALDYLIRRLDEGRPDGAKVVPEEVVQDLSAHATEGSPYFKDDLAATLDALKHTRIGTGHWRTLEQICTVADRAASASYRRLRRR